MFKTAFIKLKKLFKWIWEQVNDWHNLVILLVVAFIFSGMPLYILGFIFGATHLHLIASGIIAFWVGPFTPFWPLCIAITLFIRRIFDKKWAEKQKELKKQTENSEIDNK